MAKLERHLTTNQEIVGSTPAARTSTMKLLIGSRAANFWHPEITIRSDTDWDIIVATPKKDKSWKDGDVEFHNAGFLNNYDCFEYQTNEWLESPVGLVNVCSSRGLAAIKRSHLHRSLKFQKHIRDYQVLDKSFDENDKLFVEKRTELTKAEFKDRTPPLNQTVEDFFNDYVKKYINHDDIHEIVAHYERPLYTKMQEDPSLVKCHRYLWDKFTKLEKTQCVQEEAYVIAIERYIIPHLLQQDKKYPPRMAFANALERVCTTLCGGFFRDFAIDNWAEASNFNIDVFNKFLNSKLWTQYYDSYRTTRMA